MNKGDEKELKFYRYGDKIVLGVSGVVGLVGMTLGAVWPNVPSPYAQIFIFGSMAIGVAVGWWLAKKEDSE